MAEFRGDSTGSRLDGTSGNDQIRGLKGDDELFGNGGNDRIFGNKGDDIIDGGAGDDELVGGRGGDTFVFGVGHGNDVITDFRSGVDSIDLSALGITGLGDVTAARAGNGLELDLTAHGGGTILLKGFSGSLDAADFVFAQAQETPPEQEEDNETAGNDDEAGNDELVTPTPPPGTTPDPEENETGGNDDEAGNDELVTPPDQEGDDESGGNDDGSGDDGVKIQLVTSPSQKVQTGPGDDHVRIVHNEDGSIIHGQGGDDILEGGGGDDVLYGGYGSDTLYGGAGDDTLHHIGSIGNFTGGPGSDVFVLTPPAFGIINDFTDGEDLIDLRAYGLHGVYGFDDLAVEEDSGSAVITLPDHGRFFLDDVDFTTLDASDFIFANPVDGATDGNDLLRGTGDHDHIDGGDGSDRLVGRKGDDSLWGRNGNDQLVGRRGDDTLEGGEGDDKLWGGKGRDTLSGGRGDDWLQGNQGADMFVFYWYDTGDDVIDDFTDGEDLIDLQSFRLTGFADVSAVQEGSDVRIDLTEYLGGTIVLKDFDIADLDAGDFLF